MPDRDQRLDAAVACLFIAVIALLYGLVIPLEMLS